MGTKNSLLFVERLRVGWRRQSLAKVDEAHPCTKKYVHRDLRLSRSLFTTTRWAPKPLFRSCEGGHMRNTSLKVSFPGTDAPQLKRPASTFSPP